MKTRYTDIIKCWERLGISDSDIVKLLDLKSACNRECYEISCECSMEGKPSHGEDYELRCESIRKYYADEEVEIFSKYGL